jgi:Flp pilus assembly protein TadD
MTAPAEIDSLLERARALATRGEDAAAQQAYLGVLRHDPIHCAALNELGALAHAGGFRSAARTAYLQAILHHPDNCIARVNLGNLLYEEGDPTAATLHYQAALAVDPDLAEAHQGMARTLMALGDGRGAEAHRQRGFAGHAVTARPYRGTGAGVPLLLLVSAHGGNVPTQHWIDDRHFAITAVYAEYFDPASNLPPHALVFNAIGDADLCGGALDRAEEILARVEAPVINRPSRVRITGRAENARRLAAIEDLIVPHIRVMSPSAIIEAGDLSFPLLLRRPGFHTGQHFVYVDNRSAVTQAVASLAGDELLAIQYLDARGPDGLARKYRVMFIDGVAYPLHLAISPDWKVHYFSAAMAANAAHREEERRFLDDMPGVLGQRAMGALAKICAALGLDYAGIDFALASDGRVLLFEANATMVAFNPAPDPMWDYRRRAINEVLEAAQRMLLRRASYQSC